MIVKVVLGHKHARIRSKDGEVDMRVPLDPRIKARMGSKPVAFFRATLDRMKWNGGEAQHPHALDLDDRVPDQAW